MSKEPTTAAFARLHNACEPGPEWDDEEMTVRQGDVRAILLEVVRLRAEVDELIRTGRTEP